jgi:hypothetical protein
MAVESYWLDVNTLDVIGQNEADLANKPLRFHRKKNPDGFTPMLVDSSDGNGKALVLAVKTGIYGGNPGELENSQDGEDNDRCELRESNENQLSMGADAWYGFSVRIPPEFPDVPDRCVIAQVKMPYDKDGNVSPAFALRIDSGRFLVTVEHLFGTGDINLVTLASNGSCPAPAVLADLHDNWSQDYESWVFQVRALIAVEGGVVPSHILEKFDLCTIGVEVIDGALLPPADGRWTDFVLHVRSEDSETRRGEIELFANGELVVRALAEFGYCGCDKPRQYFKIGPYRNSLPVWGNDIAAIEVRDIRRGPSMADVALDGPNNPSYSKLVS